MVGLFPFLISPFGDQVPFSCIPIQPTDLSGGPSPREWASVREVTQQVLAASGDEESRVAKKRKQRRPLEEGMTDDVVHSSQSSECNGKTFSAEYSPASQMTSGLTCPNPVSIGLDEDEKEMEVEGPIVDETDLDTFLRDTAQRARDIHAFLDDFLTTFLGQDPSFEGEMSQLSEPLDPDLRVTVAKKTREELDMTNRGGRFTGTIGGLKTR